MAMQVYNRRIYKDGAPLLIRGWGYYNPPIGSGSGYDWTQQMGQLPYDLDDIAAAGGNAIRIYYHAAQLANYETALDMCVARGISVQIDYYATHNVDYSVATGGANRSSLITAISDMVTNLEPLPGIITYGIGNEVNYELGGTPAKDWYTLVEACCQAGKAIDSTRLYTTVNGDIATALTNNIFVPSMDIWCANAYRGRTLSTLPRSVIERFTKPLILTEYGYDSVDDGVEDQSGQATRVEALVREAESYYPYISGGFIFEWCDEWWKNGGGTISVHDTGGFAGADDRDGIMDEEYWGTTEALAADANISRTKKPVYTAISNYWNSTPPSRSLSKRLPVL